MTIYIFGVKVETGLKEQLGEFTLYVEGERPMATSGTWIVHGAGAGLMPRRYGEWRLGQGMDGPSIDLTPYDLSNPDNRGANHDWFLPDADAGIDFPGNVMITENVNSIHAGMTGEGWALRPDSGEYALKWTLLARFFKN